MHIRIFSKRDIASNCRKSLMILHLKWIIHCRSHWQLNFRSCCRHTGVSDQNLIIDPASDRHYWNFCMRFCTLTWGISVTFPHWNLHAWRHTVKALYYIGQIRRTYVTTGTTDTTDVTTVVGGYLDSRRNANNVNVLKKENPSALVMAIAQGHAKCRDDVVFWYTTTSIALRNEMARLNGDDLLNGLYYIFCFTWLRYL